MMNAEVGRDS